MTNPHSLQIRNTSLIEIFPRDLVWDSLRLDFTWYHYGNAASTDGTIKDGTLVEVEDPVVRIMQAVLFPASVWNLA